MCTLSWLPSANGYDLFFNRDEARSRPRAQPPALHEQHGVTCLYPVDPQGKGSWLGVNSYGVTVAMLNHYTAESSQSHPPQRSRGLLLLDQLAATSSAGVLAQVEQTKLDGYAPFILATLDGEGPLHTLTWDGSNLEQSTLGPDELVTTSSFDEGQVISVRNKYFQELIEGNPKLNMETLLAFHRSQVPGPGPFAVSMEREDAKTWSLSHIHVDGDSTSYAYADGPPHETALGVPLRMPRAAGGKA